MSTKEKVLELLKTTNQVLSGEKMGQLLTLSRTSVWKAIKELEKNGYQIKHEANGYRLLASDVLSKKELSNFLDKDSPIEKIEVFKESESTMKDAKRATIEENPVTTLFVADTQVAAKGRFGRSFYAKPSQGAYFSLLLNPHQTFDELPQYTVVMAVAVARAIDCLAGLTTEIKWVNDIYLNGKKVCGILSEAMSDVETMQITHIVIGVGINFSIPQKEFSKEIQEKATSVFPDGQPTFTRNELIAEVMNQFFYLLADASKTIRIYREKSFVLGKKVTFIRQGISYEGIAAEITELGELVVQLSDKKEILSSGEISLASIQ